MAEKSMGAEMGKMGYGNLPKGPKSGGADKKMPRPPKIRQVGKR